jgi:magnesium-transporting ATPase (P-type)
MQHVCLRGSKLASESSVVGLVIYAGPDTKILKNAESATRLKISKLMQNSNWKIFFVLLAQLIICSLVGVLGAQEQDSEFA